MPIAVSWFATFSGNGGIAPERQIEKDGQPRSTSVAMRQRVDQAEVNVWMRVKVMLNGDVVRASCKSLTVRLSEDITKAIHRRFFLPDLPLLYNAAPCIWILQLESVVTPKAGRSITFRQRSSIYFPNQPCYSLIQSGSGNVCSINKRAF